MDFLWPPSIWTFCLISATNLIIGSRIMRMYSHGDPTRSGRPTILKSLAGALVPIVSGAAFWSLTGRYPLNYLLVLLVIQFVGLVVMWVITRSTIANEDADRKTSLLVNIEGADFGNLTLQGCLPLVLVIVIQAAGFIYTLMIAGHLNVNSHDDMFTLALLIFTTPAAAGAVMFFLQQSGRLASEDTSDHYRTALFAGAFAMFVSFVWVGLYPFIEYRKDLLDSYPKWWSFALAGAVALIYILVVMLPFMRGRRMFAKQRERSLKRLRTAINRVRAASAATKGSPAANASLDEARQMYEEVFLDLAGNNRFLRYLALKNSLLPALQPQLDAGVAPADIDESQLGPFNRFLSDKFFDGYNPKIVLPAWDAIIAKYPNDIVMLDYRFQIMALLSGCIDHAGDWDAMAIDAERLSHDLAELEADDNRQESRTRLPVMVHIAGGVFGAALTYGLDLYKNDIKTLIDGVIAVLPHAS